MMQPSVVATLGSDARRFMVAMSPDLVAWQGASNPEPTVVEARLAGARVAAVPLLHPSGHHASLARRRYQDFTGIKAEAVLLGDALAKARRLRKHGSPR